MYQKIIVVGYLGRDPEMRFTSGSAQAVTNFSVATSRRYTTSDGNQVDETTWFRVSVWGRQAETCNQYLRKGSKVLVEGRLTPDKETGGPRVWTPQDGGEPRASFEISAATVRFLSSRAEDEASAQSSEASPIGDDDIPF